MLCEYFDEYNNKQNLCVISNHTVILLNYAKMKILFHCVYLGYIKC